MPVDDHSQHHVSDTSDDLVLIQGIGAGCDASFQILWRRWSPRLRSFLIRATGSVEIGEDLLQECFLRIIHAASTFEPQGKTTAWMYRICANLAYSYWRREGRSPIQSVAVDTLEPRSKAPRQEAPDAVMLRGRFVADVDRALGQLPENQRLVFLLKVGEGLTYEEIARVLQCPAGTTKSRFHHGVLKMRNLLKEWEDGLSTTSTGEGFGGTSRRG
jgi:RNA polymerase sigma-70 factor, ECF subfamily